MTHYYEIMFGLSVILTIFYALYWHKHFDAHFTLIFCFIPVTNLGYMLIARADTLEAALTANRFVYIGSCYLVLLFMLTAFSLCQIKLNRILRLLFISISTGIYICVLIGDTGKYFYKSLSFEKTDGTGRLVKEYAFGHTLFYAMLIVYFVLSITVMIYSFFRKKNVSNKVICLMMLPALISLSSYFMGKLFPAGMELVPATYVIAQICYLLVIDRVCIYNVTETCADSLLETGSTGILSFDFRSSYLGCNETAKKFFPAVADLDIDKSVAAVPELKDNVCKWLEDYKSDNTYDKITYNAGDRIFSVNIGYLYDGRRRRGYQIFITDDTQNQQYISLINRYNDDLRDEVAKKTANIEAMHNKLILGMATMVESRDNSTGGHIRRTSEVVRILIEEIRSSELYDLSDEFCNDLIKAAPMHDLGKIAVDDAILRKPGRFTDEEYAVMKTHAAEGARIVHSILEGTDDEEFHIIAENVAHYHHERWDGSGYPVGLVGDAIPLEARIMAIADVYDALVSKRVYKHSMSFSQADAIIMEGMGKHFDKSLEPCYVSARPKLEVYYSSLPVY
ncbi:MAG: HD domain-containing protein [Ruminococcus sp.]|nr:HD domain-containing protein [Ruminococcus sp.]